MATASTKKKIERAYTAKDLESEGNIENKCCSAERCFSTLSQPQYQLELKMAVT